MSKIRSIFASITIFALSTASAEITLPYLISDGMVVQRNEPVTLWGEGTPGEKVTVKLSTDKKTYRTDVDSDGKWFIRTDSLPTGGPYKITINENCIENVLCGDVFLCSGQSNMELPVNRVTDMFADEVKSYENQQIRQFLVPQITSFHGPMEKTGKAEWKECTQDNVMNYSALAYFMAKELNDKTNIPVGIINSSWGGTPVEAWISEPTMQNWPEKVSEKKIYEDDGYRARAKQLEGENYYRWNTRLDGTDPGLTDGQKWYDENLADNNWGETDLIDGKWGRDNERGTWRPVNGSHWLRKHVTLTAEQAAGDAILRMGCIEGADSAYVNGRFVGTIGYQYPPRIYKVPGGTLHEGENVVTVRVISGNGEPKAVPEKPYKIMTANGDEISLEGKWLHKIGSRMPQGPGMIFWHYTPIVLYDAMIAPLFNFPIEGVVWYQGESNVSNREQYYDLLKAMIKDWRTGYNNGNLPFYIVELADFLHPSDTGGRSAWAEMREQQAKVASSDPHASLIKNSDLGEWNDIHPLDKKTLGIRVANEIMKNYK